MAEPGRDYIFDRTHGGCFCGFNDAVSLRIVSMLIIGISNLIYLF